MIDLECILLTSFLNTILFSRNDGLKGDFFDLFGADRVSHVMTVADPCKMACIRKRRHNVLMIKYADSISFYVFLVFYIVLLT